MSYPILGRTLKLVTLLERESILQSRRMKIRSKKIDNSLTQTQKVNPIAHHGLSITFYWVRGSQIHPFASLSRRCLKIKQCNVFFYIHSLSKGCQNQYVHSSTYGISFCTHFTFEASTLDTSYALWTINLTIENPFRSKLKPSCECCWILTSVSIFA